MHTHMPACLPACSNYATLQWGPAAQDCDAALLRRFARRIHVPLPSITARRAFFAAAVAQPELACELGSDQLDALAAASHGYSGSDLSAVCRLASMAPVREALRGARAQRLALGRGSNKRQRDSSSTLDDVDADNQEKERLPPLRAVTMSDFQTALANCSPAQVDATSGGD